MDSMNSTALSVVKMRLIDAVYHSWTNQIRSTNALVPTAFKPASLLRPVWVPKTNPDSSGLPTVAFSCPLKAKHASFPDSMTLFFVLSPMDIEVVLAVDRPACCIRIEPQPAVCLSS